MQPKYRRVLLKLSGESLAGEAGHGIDFDVARAMCEPIRQLHEMGVQVAVVVGGGNFWRGRSSGQMERTRADRMGMLATVINALGLQDTLEQLGVPVRVMTAFEMNAVAQLYTRDEAVRHLEDGETVILGCGTGNPFFSTDTGASLRASELGCEIILKATMVDGVYDSDPKKNPNAKRYSRLSFADILEKNLQVMDMTAATMCRDSGVRLMVFSIDDPQNIVRAVCGEDVGTVVENA